MTNTTWKNFKIGVKLPFLEIEGNWEIDEKQANAAWELYVELATRVTTAELKDNEGVLRESITSFYSLFGITRDILKKYGPSIAISSSESDLTLGQIAVGILNKVLRPLLAKWHPILKDYEDKKPKNRGAIEHERMWDENLILRSEIALVRKHLIEYANLLAKVSGVSKLH